SDGTAAHDVVVSGKVDGTYAVDLSGLTDGPITASISVSDTAGNSARCAEDTSKHQTTSDSPAHLPLTINDGDGYISNAEKGAVSYTPAAALSPYTTLFRSSDGTAAHDVVVSGKVDGTYAVDLSGLTDGPITASISVSDTAGNSA